MTDIEAEYTNCGIPKKRKVPGPSNVKFCGHIINFHFNVFFVILLSFRKTLTGSFVHFKPKDWTPSTFRDLTILPSAIKEMNF